MSTAGRYVPHYTVADYQQWEGDWELWHGHAVSMVPSPFGAHAVLTGRIVTALTNAINVARCAAFVLPEIDWIVSDDTVVRPDVLIVCGDVPAKHVESTPALVVEVLSQSTRERDLGPKREMYQRKSVPYYLILDPDSNELSFLSLNDAGVYEAAELGDALTIQICEDCELDVRLEGLFG